MWGSDEHCMNHEADTEVGYIRLENNNTECEMAVGVDPEANAGVDVELDSDTAGDAVPSPSSRSGSVPQVGMLFKTADEAYTWYNDYAMHLGFSVRKDRQEKSKRDQEVISRLFVCSKEGKPRDKDADKEHKDKREQPHTRVGCEAYLMVKRRKRGTPEEFWVVTRFQENHNHDLVSPDKAHSLRSHRKRGRLGSHFHGINNASSSVGDSGACERLESRNHISLNEQEDLPKEDDSATVDYGEYMSENPEHISVDNPGPRLGMQFRTADEAYAWYIDYARWVGFNVRIDRQEKSKRDGIVISRLFVCSRQGKRRDKYLNRETRNKAEQMETRVGCQAYLMVKRRRGPVEDSWEVTRFQERHNHELMSPTKCGRRGAKSLEVNIMAATAVEKCWKDIFEGKRTEARNAQLNAPIESILTEAAGDGNFGGHSSNFITSGDQDMGNIGLASHDSANSRPEKRQKGTKSCSICKSRDHNRRKCPTLKPTRDMEQLEMMDSHPDMIDSEIIKDRLPNGIIYQDFTHHRGIFRQPASDIALSFYFGD